MNRLQDLQGRKRLHLDINSQMDEMYPIAHALSSKLRLQIIMLIGHKTMNVNELAQKMDVPLSTISLNVSVLEKAGLIYTESQPGARGTMKLCSRVTDLLTMNLVASEKRPQYGGEISMPVGHYVGVQYIQPTCGLASGTQFLGTEDNSGSFYLPSRFDAEIVWFAQGLLMYHFPTMQFRGVALESIEISFEACSEAINYRNEWESDISLTINDKQIGTWVCPGDFGGRRGVRNPEWWSDSSTQYGHLKTWRVDESGSYLDLQRCSDVKLSDLNLQTGDHFSMQVGVRPDALHVGGMNLFGSSFGDYQQDILLRYEYH
ncbi:helix-turn-helix domain-containing protein [Eubacteriales bacterium OttesenSCG-928-N13]|nr:helix-turn-helix domain-containing protein [Eubacteriales bacterium OttesenSCG-928-N13]